MKTSLFDHIKANSFIGKVMPSIEPPPVQPLYHGKRGSVCWWQAKEIGIGYLTSCHSVQQDKFVICQNCRRQVRMSKYKLRQHGQKVEK